MTVTIPMKKPQSPESMRDFAEFVLSQKNPDPVQRKLAEGLLSMYWYWVEAQSEQGKSNQDGFLAAIEKLKRNKGAL